MTITARVIADSISPQNIRLTTMQLRYPKCIHGEFMTHRLFSRNASSSRAIPVERLIQDVLDDSYIPAHWGKNQKGMQANEECNNKVLALDCLTDSFGEDGNFDTMGNGQLCELDRKWAWLVARNHAVGAAYNFHKAGYHKQIVNRLIEPFCHINVVVTSTEWSNFFALRDHADAQPEIRMLAQAMKKTMAESTPKPLKPGEWHLPYVTIEDVLTAEYMHRYVGRDNDECWDSDGATKDCIKMSVARCARVSYLTQEGRTPTIEKDLTLYDRLISSVPLHASPAEHQTTPDEWLPNVNFGEGRWLSPQWHGNFRGWIQYRKTLKGECQ